MMNRSKLVAILLAFLAIAPVVVAGRPACCRGVSAPQVASHPCCAAPSPAQPSARKGCCKAPVAPKPAARAKNGAPLELSVAPDALGTPVHVSVAVPRAVSLRLARCAHHANAPDESPPDLLAQFGVLLI